MNKNKFRLDIIIRLVPENTRFPIIEKQGSEESNNPDYRSFAKLAAMSKAGKLVDRAMDEAFGQEEL